MNKTAAFIIIGLLFGNSLHAQVTESLTNSSIIKMVRAKLSDELIIDEITSSKVNFNMSIDSTKFLVNEHVSSLVIQAMKTADSTQKSDLSRTIVNKVPLDTMTTAIRENKTQNDTLKPASALKTEAAPGPPLPVQGNEAKNNTVQNEPASKTGQSSESSVEIRKTENGNNNLNEKAAVTITISALSYVKPLKDLISFCNYNFYSLSNNIQKWNKQIKDSLDKEIKMIEQTKVVEKDLITKINENTLPFNYDVLNLKKNSNTYRDNYYQLKNNILKTGDNILAELDFIRIETDNSIQNNFEGIIKSIKKSNPDPMIPESPELIVLKRQNINYDDLSFHIVPVNIILEWYQNEIFFLKDTIELWTNKVRTIIQQDSLLGIKLEPLKNQLSQYQQNSKLNKLEIRSLKKQISILEEQRETLTNKMVQDSKSLSLNLLEIQKKFQFSLDERIGEAQEKIRCSFRDNF